MNPKWFELITLQRFINYLIFFQCFTYFFHYWVLRTEPSLLHRCLVDKCQTLLESVLMSPSFERHHFPSSSFSINPSLIHFYMTTVPHRCHAEQIICIAIHFFVNWIFFLNIKLTMLNICMTQLCAEPSEKFLWLWNASCVSSPCCLDTNLWAPSERRSTDCLSIHVCIWGTTCNFVQLCVHWCILMC